MKAWLPVLILLAAGLAGCSGGGDEVVVVDSAQTTVHVQSQNASLPAKKTGDEGHIAGYVVDQAFHILEGITVSLPAFGLKDETDRKGEFAFVDLPAGSYLLSIKEPGYQSVRTMIDVKEDEFTRLQVILRATPPPAPFHETWAFQDIAWTTNTDPGFVGYYPWWVVNASAGLHTIILEAFMDPYAGAAGGRNGFEYRVEDTACCETFTRGKGGNPLYVAFQVNGTDAIRDAYEVMVAPFGDPVPEQDKEMEVFITMFYNGPPPEGWSVQEA